MLYVKKISHRRFSISTSHSQCHSKDYPSKKTFGSWRSISTLSHWEPRSLTFRLGVMKEKLWRHNGLKGYLLLKCRIFQLDQLFKVNSVWFGKTCVQVLVISALLWQIWTNQPKIQKQIMLKNNMTIFVSYLSITSVHDQCFYNQLILMQPMNTNQQNANRE